MKVYVVDASAAIELARRGYSSSGDRELYAPTLLRSQVFSILHREVAAGDCDDTETLQRNLVLSHAVGVGPRMPAPASSAR